MFSGTRHRLDSGVCVCVPFTDVNTSSSPPPRCFQTSVQCQVYFMRGRRRRGGPFFSSGKWRKERCPHFFKRLKPPKQTDRDRQGQTAALLKERGQNALLSSSTSPRTSTCVNWSLVWALRRNFLLFAEGKTAAPVKEEDLSHGQTAARELKKKRLRLSFLLFLSFCHVNAG